MSMEINGRYNYVKTNYAEQQKTKYLDQMEKAKETQKEENNKKVSDQSSKPEVAYISSEKSGEKPNGLYRVGEDEIVRFFMRIRTNPIMQMGSSSPK